MLNKLIKVSLPVGAWLSLILSWGDVQSLCEYLNEWSNFIYQYNTAFSSYYTTKFSLARGRNFSCLFWLTPVAILMFIMRPNNVFNDDEIFGLILGQLQIAVMLGTRAMSYVKDFMLLQTVRAAYEETLNGINAEYGKCQKNISREQVRQWMDLVSFIRKQAGRVESHISFQNLWSVFEIFTSVLLILSMAVFLFMNNALGESLTGNFLPFSIVCTCFFLCSLYWKTEIVEQLVSKVKTTEFFLQKFSFKKLIINHIIIKKLN